MNLLSWNSRSSLARIIDRTANIQTANFTQLLNLHPLNKYIKIPKSIPTTSPVHTYNTFCRTALMGEILFSETLLKATVVHIPNIVIATMSSKLDAAISVVGIPFLTPYPRYYKNIQLGTRTAGETAAITNPIEKAREIGR